jgi:cytidine deaminase
MSPAMILPRRFPDLDISDRSLIVAARDASIHAYAPYSGFAVGAAVRTRSGKVFNGANLENAAYGVGMCAEVAAITAANSAGHYDIEAIAVAGLKFTEAPDATKVVAPCGRCRQLIFEASQVSGIDVTVFSCSGDLTQIRQAPISKLLPEAFGPNNLGLQNVWPHLRGTLVRRIEKLRQDAPAPPNNESLEARLDAK